ncbi:Acetylcholinesterase like protein [Argiope bruennichi]|uniref:Acetylcholinesterase like protein n=1 Tax=Argiope bruennichi TaxID=94029 RepID=A0A8T0EC01_ARGBR|nr:Acetylcholinesterase like protein [Argiope bruennichi]
MEPKISFLLIINQGIILFLAIGVSSDPLVQVEDSQIWGEEITFEDNSVHQYLGIPYAEPPVGDRRFMKTEPLASLPKQYKAVYEPPACRQYTETPFPWYFNDVYKSENCLYLNIWTPADACPENPKPVMVWVHSGNHKFGSSSLDHYSGKVLSALGDIVLVTLNYRLGVFGFLSSDTDDAPGNAGQSSAATVVGYFTLNDGAQNLYDKLIMQSGSPVNFGTDYRQRNIDLGKKIAKMVGCDKEDLDEFGSSTIQCLKDLSADDLENAEYELSPNSTSSWHPITGDEFLPKNPRKSVLDGKFNCKTLLIGNNRDEGSVIPSLLDMKSFGFYGENDFKVDDKIITKLISTIMKVYPDLSKTLSVVSELPTLSAPLVTPAIDNPLLKKLPDPVSVVTVPVPVDKLPAGIPDVSSLLTNSILGRSSSDPDCKRHHLHSALGDLVLICPSVYFAEKCAEQGNDVYYYFFIHRPSNTPFASWMGVPHFSEIPFVFGIPLTKPDDYTEEERDLSRQMIHYWSEFVKTGKPDPSWPKYSQDKPIYKVIGGQNGTKPLGKGPHKTNCDLLRLPHKLL